MASVLSITSAPAGLLPAPEPNPVTSWTFQIANTYTVDDFAITFFQFAAQTDGGNADSYVFCINGGDGLSLEFGRVCPRALNFLGSGRGDTFGFNGNGLDGVTFTRIIGDPDPTPAPAALALFGLGAALLAGARVRTR